ncbi:MAG: asparaginase domain-containing protein [Lawsonibacter sp.]
MKKRILMLATGGTIASRESGQGLAPAITSEEPLGYVPGIGSCAGWRPSS